MDISSGLAAASAALTTVRQIVEIDKALSQAELKLKMASLYSDLADVRIALSDARDQIAALQSRSGEEQTWEALAARYHLISVAGRAYVYALRNPAPEDVPHWLCPNCFGQKRSSPLQSQGNEEPNGRRGSNSRWRCLTCKAETSIPYTSKPKFDGEA